MERDAGTPSARENVGGSGPPAPPGANRRSTRARRDCVGRALLPPPERLRAARRREVDLSLTGAAGDGVGSAHLQEVQIRADGPWRRNRRPDVELQLDVEHG